jgi:XTP/dITP diphosphohydrolase
MNLVFASSNKNKIQEIAQLMPSSITIKGLGEIGCTTDIPETSDTIEGNAVLKANFVKDNYQLDCFADDTGLEVTALQGAPGVYSARYAGEHCNSEDNIDKLLKELEEVEDRSAQFKTVVALNLGDKTYLFEGIVKGNISKERIGTQGFGYDSVFIPEGSDRSFAQFSMQEKATVSHRGIAIRRLMEFLKN